MASPGNDELTATLVNHTPVTPPRVSANEELSPNSPAPCSKPNLQGSSESTPIPASPISPAASVTAGNTLSPSPLRSSSGLSELSKQLRALQAQNEAKSSEIDRLTRQIQILADLQGISVANLRKALDDACEAAAVDELQSRVAGLKAQLQAANAIQGKSVTEEVMAKKVANLELKVGELEELDERQRKEKRELFSRLRQKADQVAELETRALHLESENKQLQEEKANANAAVANAVVGDTVAEAVVEKVVPMNESLSGTSPKEKAHYDETIANLETKLREAESQIQTTSEKLKLSDEQKQSEGDQAKLRNSQFKARFMVQEENIRDLEQQLSSLYTAFTLLRDERDVEEAQRKALQSSLGQADAMVARLQGAQQQQQPQNQSKPEMIPVVSTQLWVRGGGNFRKWKKQKAVLYSCMSHYILDVSMGQTFNIYFELARVSQHRLQVFGFVIHLNPKDPSAPELYLAALNKEDYATWMGALNTATTLAKQSADTEDSTSSRMQEDLEFEQALKLSEQEK